MALLSKITAQNALTRSRAGVDPNTIMKGKDYNDIVDAVNELDTRMDDLEDGIYTIETISTDTINEATAAAGVTADGVLLKDSSIALADGAVGNLAVKIGADTNNGLYGVSDTQLGIAVEGALVGGANASGLFTDVISEQTGTLGVTIDGALIKDGAFTGKQATATATVDGLTTGILSGTDQFVSVTSTNADHIVALPRSDSAPIGTVIRGWVGANGFELRVDASEAATATINGVTTNVEAAIPATTLFYVTKAADLTWILVAETELGARIAAIVPDAV